MHTRVKEKYWFKGDLDYSDTSLESWEWSDEYIKSYQ